MQLNYPLALKSDWFGECDYEERGYKITEMKPSEYLKQVRPLKIDSTSRENIEFLKKHIQSGKTLDPLIIYKNNKEDGRHRAIASKELGITSIPVIVYNKTI